MKTLKTSLIAALIVPTFALSVMAMPASASFQPAVAYDHHQDDDAKRKAQAKQLRGFMRTKCAEAEDAEKCMADMKAKMKAKKAKMKKKKADGEKKDGEKKDGNDPVTGGDGNDPVTGGDGNDPVVSGDGNDPVTGDDGIDT